LFFVARSFHKGKETIILKTNFLFLEVNVANFITKYFTQLLDGTSYFRGDFSFDTILNYKMIGEINI
jgi:hypothetical protein